MCLYTIHDKFPPLADTPALTAKSKDDTCSVWKVLSFPEYKPGYFQSPIKGTDKLLPMLEWIKAESGPFGELYTEEKVYYRDRLEDEKYTPGFHCFISEADAKKWEMWMVTRGWGYYIKTVQVHIRGIRTVGTQALAAYRTIPCIVADEMFVPS